MCQRGEDDEVRHNKAVPYIIIAGVSIRISCHRNYVQAGDQEIYLSAALSGCNMYDQLQDPMVNINFIIIDNIVSHVTSFIYDAVPTFY